MKASVPYKKDKEGAALLVALWVLIILALITGSFAFEMKLESKLISYQRKRFAAEALAYSGVEYARALLDQQEKAKELEVEDLAPEDDDDGFMRAALMIKQGAGATLEKDLGEGKFKIEIGSAESGLNVNLLKPDDWKDLFEASGVPNTEWDAMIDCLVDWIDQSDEHQLNGAESDDPYYEERGYPVKNGMLDSVEELLLVKNWGKDILYGKAADDESDAITGIADHLTVWGDGRVNLNTVSADTLYAMGLTPEDIEAFLEDREMHREENEGLPQDYYLLEDQRFKLKSEYLKVTSVGDVHGTRYQVTCILLSKGKDSVPVYWEEGPIK